LQQVTPGFLQRPEDARRQPGVAVQDQGLQARVEFFAATLWVSETLS
jgi:hypothetical protein